MVSRESPGHPTDLEREIPEDVGITEGGKRNPPGGGDFVVRPKRGMSFNRKDKGPGKDQRFRLCSGGYIVELAERTGRVEPQSYLFICLPDGGCEQVLIIDLTPSARQSHVARPGIPTPLGSADDQNGIGVGTDRHRNRRFIDVPGLDRAGLAAVQPERQQLLKRAQWHPQLPPPQPCPSRPGIRRSTWVVWQTGQAG